MLAVVPQLLDRLEDVVERAVLLRLARPLLVDRRVPAPAQLLERRHVDAAVVQVVVELGHVAVEEAPVHPDAVAAQRRRTGASGRAARGTRARRAPRRRRRSVAAAISVISPDFVCMLRTKSSMRASVASSWWTTICDAVVEQGQVGVGDDARDLDDHVALDIEPGHLEIDPHQAGRRRRDGSSACRHAAAPLSGLTRPHG